MRRTAFASKAGIVGVWHQLNMGSQEQRPENVRLGGHERLITVHFVVKTVIYSHAHHEGSTRESCTVVWE